MCAFHTSIKTDELFNGTIGNSSVLLQKSENAHLIVSISLV